MATDRGAAKPTAEPDQVKHLVETTLNPQDQGKFNKYGFTQRLYAAYGKKYVIWKDDGFDKKTNQPLPPRIIAIPEVVAAGMNLQEGFSITFHDAVQGLEYKIGHAPTWILGQPVFGWVSHFQSLDWKLEPKPGTTYLRGRASFSFVVKMQSRPEYHNKGSVYLADLMKFKEFYPAYKDVML